MLTQLTRWAGRQHTINQRNNPAERDSVTVKSQQVTPRSWAERSWVSLPSERAPLNLYLSLLMSIRLHRSPPDHHQCQWPQVHQSLVGLHLSRNPHWLRRHCDMKHVPSITCQRSGCACIHAAGRKSICQINSGHMSK